MKDTPKPPKAFPTLQDFRLTPDGKLTLFLKQGEVMFTRRLKLAAESGPQCYFPDGVMCFARGYMETPSQTAIVTRRDGRRGRLVYHKDKRPFRVYVSRELFERVEAEVWPIMRADPNRAPQPYFKEEPAQEDVQTVQPEHLNAAD